MKNIVIAVVVSLLFTIACSEQADPEKITDPTEHHMKFIPQNPVSNDQIKLVVYDDCTYNTLSGIKQDGYTIEIEKRFNSMMKLPCMMRNDTIIVGKLSEGIYTVNYKLLDTATPATPKTALWLSFILVVSK